MYKYFFQNFPVAETKGKKMKKNILEQKLEMGYCPFEHWLGAGLATWHGCRGVGSWAAGRQARARALGRARAAGARGAFDRQAGAHGRAGRAGAAGARQARGMQAGARGARAAGARRALGTRGVQACSLCAPGRGGWAVGCALGALNLF